MDKNKDPSVSSELSQRRFNQTAVENMAGIRNRISLFYVDMIIHRCRNLDINLC